MPFYKTAVMRKNLSFLFFLFTILHSFSQAPEIRVYPDDHVYVYEVSLKDSLFDLMLHTIGITNTGSVSLRIEQVQVNMFYKEKICQQHIISEGMLLRDNRQLFKLQQSKLLEGYDFMFRTKDVLGGAEISSTALLEKNKGIILRKQYFQTSLVPDSLEIKVTAETAQKKKKISRKTIRVSSYQSPNQHYLPVSGSWYVAAAPAPNAHHRWGYMEEFAYDLIVIGDSNRTYRNDYTLPQNYYCYGQPVYATEDGEVAEALDGIADAEIYPKELSQDEYMKFIQERQGKLLERYGFPGLQGNHIIIKHTGNEYSFFAHLQTGSLLVKTGDKVKKGQIIARVGNSGNSTEPHLHFQMNESPDVFKSRGIPVRFKNINWSESLEPADAYLKNGDIVRSINK